MIVVYRLTGNDNKDKKRPIYHGDKDKLTKLCHESLLRAINIDKMLYVADNPTPFMLQLMYLNQFTLYPINLNYNKHDTCLGASGKSYRNAIRLGKMFYDKQILFAEDDYYYLNNAVDVIEEGLREFEVVAPYICPDHDMYDVETKEVNGRKWKRIPSTPLTFACRGSYLEKEHERFEYWGAKSKDLWADMTARTPLWAPVPSVATHMETEFLATSVDWSKEWEKYA